jgi:hypothetical protein
LVLPSGKYVQLKNVKISDILVGYQFLFNEYFPNNPDIKVQYGKPSLEYYGSDYSKTFLLNILFPIE